MVNTYAEIYYYLILSTLSDYSFIHMASSIWNCISFWVLVCKSHHVKFITIVLTVNIPLWSYAKSIHFIFLRFLKLGLLYLHYFFTLTRIMSNLLRNTCVFYYWECIICEFWIKIIGCCYRIRHSWFLKNTTPLLYLNLSFILHLTVF